MQPMHVDQYVKRAQHLLEPHAPMSKLCSLTNAKGLQAGAYDVSVTMQDEDSLSCSASDCFRPSCWANRAETHTALNVESTKKSSPELPQEMWDMILRVIDDHLSLIACTYTCHTLRVIAQSIIRNRTNVVVEPGKFARRLALEPTLAYFLRSVSVPVHDLPTFAVEFMGRLRKVEILSVQGGESSTMLAFHWPSRLALSQFKSIVSLDLYRVTFTTFTECVRMLCALHNLRNLYMWDTSYITEYCRSECTLDKPFAKSLHLTSVKLWAFGTMTSPSLYMHLIRSPQFSSTLIELTIHISDSLYFANGDASSETGPAHSQHLAALTSLRYLKIVSDIQESSTGSSCAVPNFLDCLCMSSMKSLRITYYNERCQCQLLDPRRLGGNFPRCFERLDDTLDSPRFYGLDNISISLYNLLPEDVRCISTLPSHLLPFPALRRWELLDFDISSRDDPYSHTIIVHSGAQTLKH